MLTAQEKVTLIQYFFFNLLNFKWIRGSSKQKSIIARITIKFSDGKKYALIFTCAEIM